MYKLRDKAKRNEQLKRYKRENPDITLQELGDMFGISKERARYILKNRARCHACSGTGWETYTTPAEKCHICGGKGRVAE